MQAFACKMAECLLDVSDDSVSSNPSLVCLRRWSLECSGLAMCFCLGNPDAVTHLNFLNMQTGELFQAPAPDDFHTKLLVSKTALCFVCVLVVITSGLQCYTEYSAHLACK